MRSPWPLSVRQATGFAALAAALLSGPTACVSPSEPDATGAESDAPNAEAVEACNTLLDAATDADLAHCPNRTAADRAEIRAAFEASIPPCVEAIGVRDAQKFADECLPAVADGYCPETEPLPEACNGQIQFNATAEDGDGAGDPAAAEACHRFALAYADALLANGCDGASGLDRTALAAQLETTYPGGCAEADGVRDVSSLDDVCLPGLAALGSCPTAENIPDACAAQILFNQKR